MSPGPPGTHSSGPGDAPGRAVIEGQKKSGRMTASTTRGRPFSAMVRPTIEGSAPKRRFHNACDSTTADGSAALLWNGSPSSGRAPSTSKKDEETLDPGMRSGSPAPVSVYEMCAMPAKPLKLVAPRCRSSMRPGPRLSVCPESRTFHTNTRRSPSA